MLLDLVVLDLSFNLLEGGDGARALKDLPSLEEIYLGHNELGGNVGHFGKSETLRIVDLCTYIVVLAACLFYIIDRRTQCRYIRSFRLLLLLYCTQQLEVLID